MLGVVEQGPPSDTRLSNTDANIVQFLYVYNFYIISIECDIIDNWSSSFLSLVERYSAKRMFTSYIQKVLPEYDVSFKLKFLSNYYMYVITCILIQQFNASSISIYYKLKVSSVFENITCNKKENY